MRFIYFILDHSFQKQYNGAMARIKEFDSLVPQFYSQQLADLTRGAQRAEIDSGHLLFLEQPAELAKTIATFLDSFRI